MRKTILTIIMSIIGIITMDAQSMSFDFIVAKDGSGTHTTLQSAMIQKTSSGSGINVKILDYNGKNNITTITANQSKRHYYFPYHRK